MYRVGTAFVTIAFLGLIVGLKSDVRVHSSTSSDQRTYIGVARCKLCHRSPKSGNQYGIWEESAHAKAYQTLASDEAKAIAAKKGIKDPQTADECLSCHVTAHGVAADLLGPKYDVADGVECESCHGPGSDYYKKSTMEGLFKGEIEPDSVGLVMPKAETCTKCHNEKSPTFKSFNFDEMFKKIAHPVPKDTGDSGNG